MANLFQNKRPATGGTLNRMMPHEEYALTAKMIHATKKHVLFMEVVRSPGFHIPEQWQVQTCPSHINSIVYYGQNWGEFPLVGMVIRFQWSFLYNPGEDP